AEPLSFWCFSCPAGGPESRGLDVVLALDNSASMRTNDPHALMVVSVSTQIRSDFLALGFSLLSVYLFLLTNGRPQAIGAAICAGIAPLVKQTFLAVPIAIISWLIYRRRYKEAVFWATDFALTVVGGYAIVWWRE